MSKYTANNFFKSLSFAFKGIRLVIKSQLNFRIQLFFAFAVILAGIFLKFSITELCLLLIVISSVLICELFNSVIEFVLDATYRNKYSKLVEMSKDMSAAGVLIASVTSIAVGILLFSNKLIPLIMTRF